MPTAADQPAYPPNATVIAVTPTQKQWELRQLAQDESKRIIVVHGGRRSGKTNWAGTDVVEFGINHPTSPADAEYPVGSRRPTEIGVFAPDFRRTERIVREITTRYRDAIKERRKAEHSLILKGDCRVQWYTGENLASSRGEGFDRIYADEAVDLSEHGMSSHVFPTMSDRGGRLFMLTTPNHGRANWVNKMFLDAKAGLLEDTGWFHMDTYDNPHVPRAWIEREKNRVDAVTFAEEYMALVQDKSSRWLDRSKVRYCKMEDLPPDLFWTATLDTAWTKPDLVDRERKERKDASVIHIQAQSHSGNVYSVDGYHDRWISAEPFMEKLADFCIAYPIQLIHKESIADDDGFQTMWTHFLERRFATTPSRMPQASVIRSHRAANWKYLAIRDWAGRILDRDKFWMVQTNPLVQAMQHECDLYNEADSRADRCSDDWLVTAADILLPKLWQGSDEVEIAKGERPWSIYFDRNRSEDTFQYQSRRSII